MDYARIVSNIDTLGIEPHWTDECFLAEAYEADAMRVWTPRTYCVINDAADRAYSPLHCALLAELAQ